MSWEGLYNFFGIRDFIYFISSSQLQDYLFPIKLAFAVFAMFFLACVIYFMINSSWLQYKFLEDVTEFFSWRAYGLREITKQWQKIRKKMESESEAEHKLAIIEADDFLIRVLDQAGYYDKDDFTQAIKSAGRLLAGNESQILAAHEARNSIVYNPDYKLSLEQVKKLLDIYESAVNSVGAG